MWLSGVVSGNSRTLIMSVADSIGRRLHCRSSLDPHRRRSKENVDLDPGLYVYRLHDRDVCHKLDSLACRQDLECEFLFLPLSQAQAHSLGAVCWV